MNFSLSLNSHHEKNSKGVKENIFKEERSQMSLIATVAQVLLSTFIVLSIAVLALIALYRYNSRFERWMNHAFLFPAAAAQRRGVWTQDPKYWEFVSPKCRVAPRGCDNNGRPPFDTKIASTALIPTPHSHVGHRLHRRSHTGAVGGRGDDVPLLIPK